MYKKNFKAKGKLVDQIYTQGYNDYGTVPSIECDHCYEELDNDTVASYMQEVADEAIDMFVDEVNSCSYKGFVVDVPYEEALESMQNDITLGYKDIEYAINKLKENPNYKRVLNNLAE